MAFMGGGGHRKADNALVVALLVRWLHGGVALLILWLHGADDLESVRPTGIRPVGRRSDNVL